MIFKAPVLPKSGLKKFLEEERALFLERFKVTTFLMASPLVVLFTAVDWFFCPDKQLEFLKYRLMVIPVALVCWGFAKSKIEILRKVSPHLPGHLFAGFLGWLNAYLALHTGAENSAYFSGLNLVAIGSLSFMPWNTLQMTINAIVIYGPFFLLLGLSGQEVSLKYVVPHLSFAVATTFLGYIIITLFRHLRIQEFVARDQLQAELVGKTEIIRKKTEEGIYLEKLSLQFSPQVVDAIKSREISLEGLMRREVTCMFIDVENSTSRSNRIDQWEYSKILAEFFSECVEILLRHNVTVGTYLGDGMLAFVNAPGRVEDHRAVAVLAARDVLEARARKARYFFDKWASEFNIRIGINTGFVSVGFFPNAQRGTYTVVGRPVNLAARLCSVADRNTVCVSKEFLKVAGDKVVGLEVKKIKHVGEIKGFEGEQFDLFSLSLSEGAVSASTERERCPLCGGRLIVQSNFKDSRLLECEGCNYRDIVDVEALEPIKKAG